MHRNLKNQVSAGGNRSVNGHVNEAEAYTLGIKFVGPGYKVHSPKGKDFLIFRSKDGLRQFRSPTLKTGRSEVTGLPYSKTGKVANFETFFKDNKKIISNVHLDVK